MGRRANGGTGGDVLNGGTGSDRLADDFGSDTLRGIAGPDALSTDLSQADGSKDNRFFGRNAGRRRR